VTDQPWYIGVGPCPDPWYLLFSFTFIAKINPPIKKSQHRLLYRTLNGWKNAFLCLVWELNYRRGLEERKSTSYSKLNKKGILAPTIPSGFVTSKFVLHSEK
jgi:hypothetical protein